MGILGKLRTLIGGSRAVTLAKQLRDPLARLARFVGPTSPPPSLHVLDEVFPELDVRVRAFWPGDVHGLHAALEHWATKLASPEEVAAVGTWFGDSGRVARAVLSVRRAAGKSAVRGAEELLARDGWLDEAVEQLGADLGGPGVGLMLLQQVLKHLGALDSPTIYEKTIYGNAFPQPSSAMSGVVDALWPLLAEEDALRARLATLTGSTALNVGWELLALRHHAWYAATAMVFQRDTPELDALNDRLDALLGERLGDVQHPPNYSEWFDNRHHRYAALVRKDQKETMRAIGRSFAEILGGDTAKVAPVAERLHEQTFFLMVSLCRAARSDQPSGTPAA